MAAGIYDIRFILSVTDRTGNSLRRFAGDMRGATKDAKRMQRAFVAMDVGRGLQLRGLIAGAGLAAAAQQAATFSSAVTKAATQAADSETVQKVGQNTVKLQEQILDLMSQFPGSAQQQADAAYDIFSAMNVPLQKGVGLLKLFNMVAVAGATDIETATNAMITVFNTFGGTFEQNMKAVETSFGIIHYGRLEFDQFEKMLASVVPAAKGAGMSLEDVAGAMAFLTTRMGAGFATTGLSRMLEVIARPDFRKGAKKLGLEFEDMNRQLKPFPELIKELARLPMAKAKGTIGQLIPVVTSIGRGGGRGVESNVMARRALVALVSDEKQYQQIQKLTLAATGEFEKRYVAMIGSAGVKWEKFKATLQAVVITVGAAALPWLEKLGHVVSRGIDWVKANKGMIEFAVKATLAGAAAALLIGTLAKIYAGFVISSIGARSLGGALLKLYRQIVILVTITKLWTWYLTGSGLAALTTSARLAKLVGWLGRATIGLRLAGASMLTMATLATFGTTRLLGLGRVLSFLVRGSPWIIAAALIFEFKEDIWDKMKDTLGNLAKGMGGTIPLGIGPAGIQVAPPPVELDPKKTKKAAKKPVDDFAKMLQEIRRLIGKDAKDIFNTKMFKDLGLDPASIQKAIDNLLNPDKTKAGSDAAANAKRIAQEITDRTKELLKQASDGLMQVYNDFKTANETAFGSIFEPIEGEGEEAQLRKAWNWTGGANNLLDTMKARLAQFTKWRGMLNKLLKKGYSKEFVEEFKKMGPEGLKHWDELIKAGPKKVAQFNTTMGKSKGAITKATEIDFDAQLDKWNKFGKNMAFKIAAGLESEEQGLQKRMVGAVDRMWGGVAEAIARNEVLVAEAARKAAEAAAGGLVVPDVLKAQPTGKGKDRVYTAPTTAGVAAAGIGGKYAVPSASTGGLSIAAVTAMGARYQAMAEAYGVTAGKPPGWVPPAVPGQIVNIFQVDGTFLTHEESMNAALKMSDKKTKNKR